MNREKIPEDVKGGRRIKIKATVSREKVKVSTPTWGEYEVDRYSINVFFPAEFSIYMEDIDSDYAKSFKYPAEQLCMEAGAFIEGSAEEIKKQIIKEATEALRKHAKAKFPKEGAK